MIYVRLDTKALTNGKLLAAGPLAFTLYVKGLLYSKDHLLDGFIPANALPILVIGMDDAKPVVADLVKQGLWVETDGGWTVGSDRWAEFQTTASQVNDSKRAAAERKARSRDRAKSQQVDGTSDNCVTSDPCHENVTRDKKVTLSKTETEPETESESETEICSVTDVTGADEPRPSEPFATVERVLTAVNEGIGKPPPDRSMVGRYLGKNSSVISLVKSYGEADATRLFVWGTVRKRLGMATIRDNAASLWAEAEACNWGAPPERGKKSGWGDPAEDIRKMTEDLLRG